MHPYIQDVDAELEQIKAEQEEAMEQFGSGLIVKEEPKEDGDGLDGNEEE